LLAFLAACSSGPSDRDVEQAVKKNVEMTGERIKSVTGITVPDSLRTELRSAKNLGCSDAGGNAYNCDVEVDIKSPVGDIKQTSKLRLVKGSEGWAVSQ
jgi:hypothetical protein